MTNHILFINNQKELSKKSPKLGSRTIYLFNPLYKINFLINIPKTFSITTNDESEKFNIDMLKDTSRTILEFALNNPQTLTYHINIYSGCTLRKFKQMYQGEVVNFIDNEIPIYNEFRLHLKITNIPSLADNFSYYHRLKKHDNSTLISYKSLKKYIKNFAPHTFIIKTKKKEYQCNNFGILSSKVICDFLSKNPAANIFIFDFDDECNEFQSICNVFNLQKVDITVNNVNSIKEIAESLQITSILSTVTNFISEQDTLSQIIDNNQELIDSIDLLFDHLCNIKEKTVETVKEFILKTFWSQTEDNVRELAAFVLQVIQSDLVLHQKVADLLYQLNQEANETNKLDILVPFIVSKLMSSFAETVANCSFVYNLYKLEMIQKEEIADQLKTVFQTANKNKIKYSLNWFLAEIMENNSLDEDEMINICDKNQLAFLLSYLPDDIEKYKEMRDQGEPENELIRALRSDDVDELKNIIIANQIDIQKAIIPYNIFEDFIENGKTNFIDYSAAYGSLKCFKYLFLNHEKVDPLTFEYSIFGSNNEIIKIVDQNLVDNANYRKKIKNIQKRKNDEFKLLIPPLMKHQNDLFDWILAQKFMFSIRQANSLNNLALISIENGNVHSLIELIDNGYNFQKESLFRKQVVEYTYQEVIEKAAINGFYRLALLLTNFIQTTKGIKLINSELFVYFGNLSIFRLVSVFLDPNEYEKCFISSINNDSHKLLDVCFEQLLKKDISNAKRIAFSSFSHCIQQNKNDTFKYLINHFKTAFPAIFMNFDWCSQLMPLACKMKNFELVKLILNLNSENAFSTASFMDSFYMAALSGSFEICQYLVDQKVLDKDDFQSLLRKSDKLVTISKEIFELILKNSNEQMKEHYFSSLLYPAIQKNNKDLVGYLLAQDYEFEEDEEVLVLAVQTRDLEMVNIVLNYNSQPYFVNRLTSNGTALWHAVRINSIEIVNRLLSIPGINPNLYSLYNDKTSTPLTLAIKLLYFEIVKVIIDSFGNKIYQWELNEVLKMAFDGLIPYSYSNSWSYNKLKTDAKPLLIEILRKISTLKNIDPNLVYNNHSLLTYACEKNEIEIVKNLLEIETTDLNIYVPTTGDNSLMIAIKKKNVDIAMLLIQNPKIDINMKNINNQTALLLAVNSSLFDVIDAILANEKFDPKINIINQIFYFSSPKVAEHLLSSKYIDVNVTYAKASKELSSTFSSRRSSILTKLVEAVNSDSIELVNLIINHHSFDQEKSCFSLALFTAYKKDYKPISSLLVKKVDTISNYKNNDIDLFELSFIRDDEEAMTKILKSPTFVSSKTSFIKVFYNTFNSTMIKTKVIPIGLMTKMYDYDKEHENLIDLNIFLPGGRSVFTSIPHHADNIQEVVKFFLDRGVDPNIPDKNEIYPFEYAISSRSKKFIDAFVDSNKIDYSLNISAKKIFFSGTSYYTTYYNGYSSLYDNIFELAFDRCDNETIVKILKNPNFDSKKINFAKIFYRSFSRAIIKSNDNEMSVEMLDLLIKYDKEHENSIDLNHLLPDGRSVFTAIPQCIKNISELAKLFLDNGANPNIADNFNLYPFEYAIKSKITDFINVLIESNKIDYSQKISFYCSNSKYKSKNTQKDPLCLKTLFDLAFYETDTKTIVKILESSSFDSTKVNFCNLFYLALYKIEVDSRNSSVLNFELADILYEYDQKHEHLIDLNKPFLNGKSAFTMIPLNIHNHADIVKYLLDRGVDPNIPDKNNIYPFEYALSSENKNFLNALIESKKIDFYKKIYDNDTSYNQKFKNTNYSGKQHNNLFDLVLNKCDVQTIINILKNSEFDSTKVDIFKVFFKVFDEKANGFSIKKKMSIEIMTLIYEHDQKHEHLIDFNKPLPNGKSYFTSIQYFINNIVDVTKFLLDHGADPNIPDSCDIYPLEYAISTNLDEFVHVLIESNKIDYTKQISNKMNFCTNAKYVTYLHLAARSRNSKILQEFIDKKLIDFNITNDAGDSPFMEAMKFNQFANCQILYEFLPDNMFNPSLFMHNQTNDDSQPKSFWIFHDQNDFIDQKLMIWSDQKQSNDKTVGSSFKWNLPDKNKIYSTWDKSYETKEDNKKPTWNFQGQNKTSEKQQQSSWSAPSLNLNAEPIKSSWNAPKQSGLNGQAKSTWNSSIKSISSEQTKNTWKVPDANNSSEIPKNIWNFPAASNPNESQKSSWKIPSNSNEQQRSSLSFPVLNNPKESQKSEWQIPTNYSSNEQQKTSLGFTTQSNPSEPQESWN